MLRPGPAGDIGRVGEVHQVRRIALRLQPEGEPAAAPAGVGGVGGQPRAVGVRRAELPVELSRRVVHVLPQAGGAAVHLDEGDVLPAAVLGPAERHHLGRRDGITVGVEPDAVAQPVGRVPGQLRGLAHRPGRQPPVADVLVVPALHEGGEAGAPVDVVHEQHLGLLAHRRTYLGRVEPPLLPLLHPGLEGGLGRELPHPLLGLDDLTGGVDAAVARQRVAHRWHRTVAEGRTGAHAVGDEETRGRQGREPDDPHEHADLLGRSFRARCPRCADPSGGLPGSPPTETDP